MKKFSFGAIILLLVVSIFMTSCICPAAKPKVAKKQYYQGVQKAPEQAPVIVPQGNGCDVCNLLKITPKAPAEAIIGETYMSEVDVLALAEVDEAKIITNLPPYLRYVKSEPPAKVEGNKLTWYLGAMNKGQTRNIKIWVTANQEGRQWLCYVPFALPRYCVPTNIGKAELEITKNGPATAELNSNVTYTIVVTNKGTAQAKGVVVTDQVPEGMLHESGRNVLAYEIGDMAANSQKTISVTLKAANRGQFCNVAVAKSVNAGEVNAKACTTVLRRELTAAMQCAPEAFVGQEGNIAFNIVNPGDAALTNVQAQIQYPSGVRVVSSDCAQPPMGGKAIWNIGSLKPGASINCNTRVVGLTEGRHCAVITVTSAEGLNARAECCTVWKGVAKIEISKDAPATATLNETFNYTIVVKNVGTGVARNVVVADMLPAEVAHPQGKQLQYTVGDLAPNASKTIVIPVKAVNTGRACNVAKATADNADAAQDDACTEIRSLSAEVAIQCPEEVFVGKTGDFRVVVQNTGGVSLNNVAVTATWGEKLQVLSAEGNPSMAGYQAVWNLGTLPAGAEKTFAVKMISKFAGEECIKVMLTTAEGITKSANCCTLWKGFPALLIEVIDTVDPLLLKEETSYVIEVTNQGTALDRDVQIFCEFPVEITPLQASGDTPGTIEGKKVTFQPYPVLQPKEKIKFIIRAHAVNKGDARLRTYLRSELLQKPVLEEESTQVY
ncbi:MAG: DUF11 domain-containing protein [Planctomycetes bacterium]|jgi:uncharacterized repeat protein (TIGR01451 family)|nr:DUF11 domain-containing protein [Planctomycetota bacterium]HPY73938.1 hypothetical protein [Planctomycetota bacterium]HQA99561.1 hypothetical protein [Planctomycetota bacterium]HRU51394.1 hypothetical protein [Planctomycetota bacterium]